MKDKHERDIAALSEYCFDSVEAIINFHKIDVVTKTEIVRQRISKRQLDQFRKVAELEYHLLATLIGITERNLHYKKKNDLFSYLISDAIGAAIDLYGFGYTVFGNDPSMFNKWMKIGSPETEYEPPLNYCDTHFGKQEVKREIFRMKRRHTNLYG